MWPHHRLFQPLYLRGYPPPPRNSPLSPQSLLILEFQSFFLEEHVDPVLETLWHLWVKAPPQSFLWPQ